ncbi:Mitochondrial Rho GTPase 2, partial [Linum grandiflorum]
MREQLPQDLPVGFGFRPTEMELVSHYLSNHISGFSLPHPSFCPVFFCDLYGSEEPWDLWHRCQSQPSSLFSTGGDVYLITKLKRKTTVKGNSKHYDRVLGTSGGNWHRSDSNFLIPLDSDSPDLVGVRKKFFYDNVKSKEHGCWLLSEYSISYDRGKTCSDDVICMLYQAPTTKAKKRKFEQRNTSNATDTDCSLLPPLSKVPKLSDGATTSPTLVQNQIQMQMQMETLPSSDLSTPSAPNVHSNELMPTIPSHHSEDDKARSESGQIAINESFIDDFSILSAPTLDINAFYIDEGQLDSLCANVEEPPNTAQLEQVEQVPLDLYIDECQLDSLCANVEEPPNTAQLEQVEQVSLDLYIDESQLDSLCANVEEPPNTAQLEQVEQVKCFNAPLQPAEIVGVRRVVQEKKRDGVNDLGLTLEGFLFMHFLFIDKGRHETTWAVLRRFGYGDNLELRDDGLPLPSKHAPDQVGPVIQIGNLIYLLHLCWKIPFSHSGHHGALRPSELDELFSTAPESPWNGAPYKDTAETTSQGNLTLMGFLSEVCMSSISKVVLWSCRLTLTTEHRFSCGENPASALRVTRRKSVDRKKHTTERSVFNCFVLGPESAGKSSILNAFLGRPFSASHNPAGERYATNVVDQLGVDTTLVLFLLYALLLFLIQPIELSCAIYFLLQGNNMTLILREIPADGLKSLLSNKKCLAACNVAVFVYDISDESSWKRARDMLVEVARQGEETGYGVPCLLVAAKEDLAPYPMALQDSLK